MKNIIHIIVFLFIGVTFFSVSFMNGQSVSSDCDALYVWNVPGYPGNLFLGEAAYNACSVILPGVIPAPPKFQLQKYSSGQWSDVGPEGTSDKFENLDPGVYRVGVLIPTARPTIPSCANDFVIAYNYLQQAIGFLSVYMDPIYTNSAIVGEAVIRPEDVTFNDYGSTQGAYDIDNDIEVTINTNNHYPQFDRYSIRLQKMQGWPYPTAVADAWYYTSSVNKTRNFSDLWREKLPVDSGAFIPGVDYKATVWVNNSNCTQWDEYNYVVTMCPSGSGCKLANNAISVQIFPNPATNQVYIKGSEQFKPGDIVDVFIMDSQGKLVKRIEIQKESGISVEDIPKGIYFFAIHRNMQHISTKKVIVE